MRLRKVWAVLHAVVGLDELMLALGLVLITASLWPGGVLALLPAGLVLTWIALPSRRPLVDRPDPKRKD